MVMTYVLIYVGLSGHKNIILHFVNQRFSLNLSSTVLFLRNQGVLKMLFIFRIGRSLGMVMFSN
jgi:hypothetical protein